MIDIEDFKVACADFEIADNNREKIIKGVRDFQRNGKSAISASHAATSVTQKKFTEASNLLLKSRSEGEALVEKLFKNTLRLRFERSFGNALEEYIEAVVYFELKKNGIDQDESCAKYRYNDVVESVGVLGEYVSHEVYLGAMADVTGELGRWTVNVAMDSSSPTTTRKRLKNILEFMQNVSDEFLQLGYSKKQEAVQRNVEKVRTLLLQCTLSRPRVDAKEPPLKREKSDMAE